MGAALNWVNCWSWAEAVVPNTHTPTSMAEAMLRAINVRIAECMLLHTREDAGGLHHLGKRVTLPTCSTRSPLLSTAVAFQAYTSVGANLPSM